MSQTLKIQHNLADVVIKPSGQVNQSRLKQMIRSTLDQYLLEDRIPAQVAHEAAKKRHGEYYRNERACVSITCLKWNTINERSARRMPENWPRYWTAITASCCKA